MCLPRTLAFNQAMEEPRLVLIAEVDLLPFGRDDANLFFNVVARRYERGRMILASGLRFIQWEGTFTDDQTLMAAMLDRLLHRIRAVIRPLPDHSNVNNGTGIWQFKIQRCYQ